MAEIGEEIERIEIVPVPLPEPAEVPVPEPVPDRELVPA